MTTSVAMCTYNGANYIREQLDSIINQSKFVDEIVICDDGSKDNTILILNEYKLKFPDKIKVHVNSQNLGYIKNFEKAISLCQNDIIFLSDQDDVWKENKVEVIINWFQNHKNKDVVFTDALVVDSNLQSLKVTLFDCVGLKGRGAKMWQNDKLKLPILSIENRVTGATLALRKIAIPYLLPFQDNKKEVIHDYQIALKSAELNKLGTIWQSLILYRTHENQNMGILDWLMSPPSTDIVHQRIYQVEAYSCLCTNRSKKYLNFIRHRYLFITTSLLSSIKVPPYFYFYGIKGFRALMSDLIKKNKNFLRQFTFIKRMIYFK